MSSIITSTTDSQAEINAAASGSRPSADPGKVTVWSTTDTHAEKQAAADAGPPEPSLGTITVSSTTDSQDEVDSASVAYCDTQFVEQDEGNITPITMSEDRKVATTTDSEETVAAVAREMEAEREEKPDHLGRHRAHKRINDLVRQREEARSEAEALRAQLEQRQPQYDQDDQAQQPQPQQLTLQQNSNFAQPKSTS